MARKTTEQEPETVEVLVGEPGPEVPVNPRGVLATRRKYCRTPNCGRWAETGTGACPHHRRREEG